MYFKTNLNKIPQVRFIGHVTYNFPWSHFERTIDEHILYIIESGEMFLEEDGIKHHLKSRDCFILEPNKKHVGYMNHPCSYYFVHFKHISMYLDEISSSDAQGFFISERNKSLTSDFLLHDVPTEDFSYVPKRINIKDSHTFSSITSAMTRAIVDYSSKLEHSKLTASLNLLEILVTIVRECVLTTRNMDSTDTSKGMYLTNSILNYINREYTHEISGKLLEKEFELNYDYMNRVFKKNTRYTIKNFVNVVRINKAKELLSTTSCKVSEAGYLVGIDNPYYFSRLFKKITGTTPLKYIKSLNIK